MASKAQGLSLNTIIIASLVLLVLLILVGMTTGYFGKWIPKFNLASSTSCSENGGSVVDKSVECAIRQNEGRGFYQDVSEGKKCCVPKACGESINTSINTVDTFCTSECESDILEESELKGCPSGKVCCLKP